ncbi:MAG: ATP-binding protein [Robiginitomaculum sp.]|nr:MAG: ATP-binding protein [Robiginitomaculum sp.]
MSEENNSEHSQKTQPQGGKSFVWGLVRTTFYWAIPALIIAGTGLILFFRMSTYKQFDDPLINTIQSLIAYVEVVESVDDVKIKLTNEPIDPSYQRALSGRYWLVGELNENGRIEPLMGSRSLYGATLTLPIQDARKVRGQGGNIVTSIAQGPDNEPLRLAIESVVFPGMGERAIVIVAAADKRPTQQAVRRFSYLAIGLMSLIALALSAAIFMQVRIGLRPFFELQRRIADVREGRARSVVGVFPIEITPLADELNSLIGHNKEVVEYAQTHVGNLAHALKTPLAVLINESKGKTTAYAKLVERQTTEMSKQVDHHLRRARAAARGQSIGEVTPVKPILLSLARTLPRIYRDKDLDIHISVNKGILFRGAQRDLEEMVGNLMDNACKWTHSEVNVTVERLGPTNAKIKLVVDDNGPGLAEEEYAIVLKRGERLDEATPGSGFGLSIVNDLARAYNGSLSLGKSPKNGLRVILILPTVVDG